MLYFSILAALIVINVLKTEGDPCSPDVYKKLPHLESRYMNYMTDTVIIQDSTLITNWYYTGDVTILNRHPEDIFQCGTKFPIWLRDPLPSQYNQEEKAMACYMSLGGSFCTKEFPINITRCSDGYFVYKLVPTASDSAYCFGVGKSGDPPTLTPSKPVISTGLQTLMAETAKRKYHYTEAYVKCIFETSPTETLLYRVLWYQNGMLLYTSSYGTSFDNVTLFLTEPHFVEYGFGLGNQISCAVQAFYEEMAPPGPLSERSDPLYAGIKVLTPTLTFAFAEEDESKRTIRLKATVPIGCLATESCYIELLASIPPGSNDKQCNSLTLEGRRCGVQMQSLNVTENEIMIVVTPADSGQYLDNEVYNEVHLMVSDTLENKIWGNYIVDPIGIHMSASEAKLRDGSRCDAQNDPHMHTFDRSHYDIHGYYNHIAGVYTMYRNEKFNSSVQLQVDHCYPGSSSYCSCGVAAQAGQDLFVISSCNGSLQIEYKSCGDNVIKVKSYKELSYEIYFPYGTYIQVYIWTWRKTLLGVHIQPSVYDEGNTLGLCGTLDGNTANDFTGKNNEILERDQFLETWRITSVDENLFDESFEVTSLTPMQMDVCICEKVIEHFPSLRNEVSCARNAVASCRKGKDTSKDMCQSFEGRKRRSVQRKPRTPKVMLTQRSIRYKREAVAWTREKAGTFCTQYMTSNPLYSICEQVQGARPEEAIEDCTEDILLTDGTDWAPMSLENMKKTCEAELSRNISLWTTDYNMTSIAETIESMVCTNNCSQQGICFEGECQCYEPFVGVDCSIDKQIPPETHGLLDDGLCDEREILCTDAHVFAYPLIDAPTLTCHLSEFAISLNGVRKYITEHIVSAEFVTLVETVCPLEGIRNKRAVDAAFVYGYVVNISYDGETASEGNDLYIFDSTCQNAVEINGQMSFTLKDGFCFIDGTCVNHEQTSMLDNCSMCDTTVSLESWSQNIYNTECVFTTTTQTSSPYTITSEASTPASSQIIETTPSTLASVITTSEQQNTPTTLSETALSPLSTSLDDTYSVSTSAATPAVSINSASSSNTQRYSTASVNNHPQGSEPKLWIIGVAVPCGALAVIIVTIFIFIKMSKPKVDTVTNRGEDRHFNITRETTSSSLTPVEDMSFGIWPAVFGEPRPEFKPPSSSELFKNVK